jgi:ABC-type multidrug transport system fused ATPase/permease subunit
MQDVVNQITANPLLSVILALVGFLLIFFVLKSFFRIALFLTALVLLYFGYVTFLQEKYPLPKMDKVSEWTEKVEEYIPKDFNFSLVDSNFTRPKPKD